MPSCHASASYPIPLAHKASTSDPRLISPCRDGHCRSLCCLAFLAFVDLDGCASLDASSEAMWRDPLIGGGMCPSLTSRLTACPRRGDRTIPVPLHPSPVVTQVARGLSAIPTGKLRLMTHTRHCSRPSPRVPRRAEVSQLKATSVPSGTAGGEAWPIAAEAGVWNKGDRSRTE